MSLELQLESECINGAQMIGRDANREGGQRGGFEESRRQRGTRNAVLVGMAVCGLGNWVGGREAGGSQGEGGSNERDFEPLGLGSRGVC